MSYQSFVILKRVGLLKYIHNHKSPGDLGNKNPHKRIIPTSYSTVWSGYGQKSFRAESKEQ